jgi:hypothetical protein
MIGILLAFLLGILLWMIVRIADRERGLTVLGIIIGGYALRLVLQLFVREVQFFNHEAGGDCQSYESMAVYIARLWRIIGVTFLTDEQIPGIGAASLPVNLFGLVVYMNSGDATRLGCTAVIAFAAGLTCFNIYHLAVQTGANPVTARRTMTLFYMGPTFLHYTSDMFKDGLVVCLAFGALASAIRLMQRISLLHVAIGVLCLWGLWYVRFYMVFVTTAPLVVGLMGMRTKSIVRPIFAALAIVAAGLVLLAFTQVTEQISEKVAITYEIGTAEDTRIFNARGGSGVVFDDGGSPFGALWLKLLYTVFSPFPWGSGSVGFHIGKIDSLVIGFFLLRAYTAARDKEFSLVVLMVLTFLVPCTVMYATSMANVGLIVRQRLVVIAAMTFMACLYRPAKEHAAETVDNSDDGVSFATG